LFLSFQAGIFPSGFPIRCMKTPEVIARLAQLRIIPVIVIDNADDAKPLAEALLAGGLPCAEVTFRTAAALDAIRIIAQVPGMLVGAGTVLKPEQAQAAADAGAQFIVTPGFNPRVVSYCVSRGIPITPGVSDPTSIELALEHGLDVVKFFPAEACGGLPYLKAIAAPYSMMRFIPTGGIEPGNLQSYLAFPKIVACGGTWMVKADLLKNRDWAKITQLTREAVALAQTPAK
jgi:2-dehydro-3-deoxyphosphogluconate aldolase/(4S)-4-hydroxy-2-oxoglutarate aldolase